MPLIYIEESAEPPVDLVELKAHLNLEGTDRWDILLEFFISASVGPTQRALGQQLIVATLQWSQRTFNRKMELPRPPLLSVLEVEYRDRDGNWVMLDPGSYETNIAADPGFVRFTSDFEVPEIFRDEEYPWRVIYRAGYVAGDGTSTYQQVPAEIRHWMMHIIGTAFMKREADVISMGSVDVVQLKAQMARIIKGHNKNVRFG